jgi:hypothetical protein
MKVDSMKDIEIGKFDIGCETVTLKVKEKV